MQSELYKQEQITSAWNCIKYTSFGRVEYKNVFSFVKE